MTTEMLRYPYIKPRYQFGKQCVFELNNHVAEEGILPDPTLLDNYVIRLSNDNYVQNSPQLAVHEVQTTPKLMQNTGILHTEGGWPKEINPNDNEAVHRYRRRIERNDTWVPSLNSIMPPMEHCVLQNGTVNIYEEYFDDLIPTSVVKYYNIKNRNSCADLQPIKRPVRYLSWCKSGSHRLAAAYSFMEFQEHSADVSPESYVWDIGTRIFLMLFDDQLHSIGVICHGTLKRNVIRSIPFILNTSKALCALKSSSPLLSIEFNPRDPAILVAGLLSGQVCCWDIRANGYTATQLSLPFYSHRFPVTQALWIPSKVNTEFFSASIDGSVLWWDTRFLKKPSDTLVMDLDDPRRANIVRAVGVTALQYEQTISSRFLAGMENGVVVNVNRRTNDRAEKLAARYVCYTGPVIAIDRNPAVLKNFLTIGDRSAKVWADDTKEGCFFSTREEEDLSGGCWSKSRCSIFFTINTRGEMKAYDVLAGIRAPLTSIHVCQNDLTAINAEQNGELIAVGSRNGDIYILQCSEDLRMFSKDDRSRLSNYLERCGRYEKAVDIRLRELHLLHGPATDEDRVRKRITMKKTKRRDSKIKKREQRVSRETQESIKRKTVKPKGKSVRAVSEPAIVRAEEDYFRRLEAESKKFMEIRKEDMDAAQELLRQRVVTMQQQEEEEKEAETEELRKDRRSIRRIWSRTRVRTQRRSPSKEMKKEASEDMISDSIRMRDRRRRSRKILKKICTEVCKPEICCKDMEEELRAKRLREAQKYKMTINLPEKMRSSLIQDRLFRKLTIQLDEIPELSPKDKRKMLRLKNASPNILHKELQLAKQAVRAWQELALARKLSSWQIERKLDEKIEKVDTDEMKEPEPEPEPQPSAKHMSEVSLKQVTLSKDSILSRQRSSRKRQTVEEMKLLEKQRQQELWEKLKQKAKEHDQREQPEITYPRISAAFPTTSSEELQKKSEVKIVDSTIL